MDITTIDKINAGDLSALDLRDEAQKQLRDGHDIEAYRVRVDGQAQAVEVLLTSERVAGVAWGSDAEWLDHGYGFGRDACEMAVLDYFEGQA